MRCQDYFFTTSSFIWYENNSESANSKFRFGDCRRTTQNNAVHIVMYQSIEIEDVGFPNILVTLCGERGWLLFPSASSFPFGMKFCDTQSQECRTF